MANRIATEMILGDIEMSLTHQGHSNKGFIEDQREFFNQLITQEWNTYINPNWDNTRKFEVDQILRIVPYPINILNIGCGCGYHDLLFAKSNGVEFVVGIDYSEKSISQANQYYSHPKVHRFVTDCFNNEEMTGILNRFGRFGLVVSFQVIEHLSRPQAFFDVNAECVKKGGYVAVVTPNRRNAINRFREIFGKKPIFIDPLHYAEYTKEEIIRMGEQSNLRPIDYFSGNFNLTFKGVTLIGTKNPISMILGQLIPEFANTIGVIFLKKG
jgi:2-polyprenyl-3-methyl-5-hydroxy-6-metoxy-1,4-benzoquinol methylase